ncbi:hypothetical protein F2P81_004795 [Scophthalmus maximus]|uniref:Uncharacterized protein n=1 Tax=Scophthalmus maximus TaxID=52904 RepID=A0A6A4TG88_SCOMX|nr:hypothetical protein F2P81_004795 [Scophthalmus maximus]
MLLRVGAQVAIENMNFSDIRSGTKIVSSNGPQEHSALVGRTWPAVRHLGAPRLRKGPNPYFIGNKDQNNWFAISKLAGVKPIYVFSPELLGSGAKLASAHLERSKCLLHSGSMHSGDYCDGAAAVMVVWL